MAVFLNGLIGYAKDKTTSNIRDAAIKTSIDLATALNDTGQPLVIALGNVTAAHSVEEARRELAVLIDRTVSLAQTELARSSKSRARAAYYHLEGDKLVRRKYSSWSGSNAPRQEFVRGRSDHDNEVIRFAHGENALLVEDLENKPPPHFIDAKGRSYKSFASVPVRAGDKSFGLLTADSDCAYAITTVELGFLIIIAGALGAGVAHVAGIEGLTHTP